MGASEEKVLKLIGDEIPRALREILFGAAQVIVEFRPKFRGADGQVADWIDHETRVKEKMEMRCRCFKCGCESRLVMEVGEGMFLFIERCKAPSRCSMSAAKVLQFDDGNHSQHSE